MENASPARLGWQDVTAALNAAAALENEESERELKVTAIPELGGVRVAECCVEVFIKPTATGIHVECWRTSANDPYKIVSVEALDDAIQLAIAEV